MLTCGKSHFFLLLLDLSTVLRRLWSSPGFVKRTCKFLVLFFDVLCKLNIGEIIKAHLLLIVGGSHCRTWMGCGNIIFTLSGTSDYNVQSIVNLSTVLSVIGEKCICSHLKCWGFSNSCD